MININDFQYRGLSGCVHRAVHESVNLAERASAPSGRDRFHPSLFKKIGRSYSFLGTKLINIQRHSMLYRIMRQDEREEQANLLALGVVSCFEFLSSYTYQNTYDCIQKFPWLGMFFCPYKMIISSRWFFLNGAIMGVHLGVKLAIGNARPCLQNQAFLETLQFRGGLGFLEDSLWTKAQALAAQNRLPASYVCRLAAALLYIISDTLRLPIALMLSAMDLALLICCVFLETCVWDRNIEFLIRYVEHLFSAEQIARSQARRQAQARRWAQERENERRLDAPTISSSLTLMDSPLFPRFPSPTRPFR